MSRPLPTLSTDGLVSSVNQKLDRLFAYYRVSQASQSVIYDGRILSLPKRMEEYDGDAGTLKSNLKQDMELLFGRHFEFVETEVEIIDHQTEDAQYTIRFHISVLEEGKPGNLSQAVEIVGGKLKRIEGF